MGYKHCRDAIWYHWPIVMMNLTWQSSVPWPNNVGWSSSDSSEFAVITFAAITELQYTDKKKLVTVGRS